MPGAWVIGESGKEFATVRISRIVLDNFKSVRHGEITLNCGSNFVQAGTESDILGVYGQNGSGKSSLIEALAILQRLVSGSRVPDEYAECIAADADHAHLYFEFDFQYPDGRRLRVSYEASIKAEQRPEDDPTIRDLRNMIAHSVDIPGIDIDELQILNSKYRICVFDEMVKVGGMLDGKNRQFRSCIDTLDTSAKPFGPTSRHADLFVPSKSNRDTLAANRILATERSKSFIFMDETMEVFHKEGENKSDFFTVLAELNLFARYYLRVVDASFGASYSSDFMLPFFMRNGFAALHIQEPMTLPEEIVTEVRKSFVSVNEVLEELIPGLSIEVKEMGSALLKDGTEGTTIEFVSRRDGLEFPLRDESDGIKKIVSVLNLFVAAFNEKSVTVAIDEFDAGIFEYLLGEMLQILEDSGRGQFIFTSHNLRPLEVLSKKYVCFTTTNPDNRYYRMKNVGKNNNLRDVYFREIVMQEQDEQLYDSGKRFRIVSSLRRAGHAVEA